MLKAGEKTQRLIYPEVGLAMRPEIFNIRNAWRWAVNAADWEQIRYSTPGLVAFYNYVGLPVEVVELLQIAIDSPELNLSTEVKLRLF